MNAQVLKTALAENQVIWETALASKSPQELVTLSASTAKASAEKAAIYGRQVQEIFSSTQSEATAAVTAQLEKAQREGKLETDKLRTDSTVIVAAT
ncbi:granule-associated protein [Caballeronia sordidicola]|uniref:Granule-associated protein n=1 Tax=Caballeronia sordidicola TaxID=196367 RepID=A0A242N4F7_CABSO|nr:granule-associated protein [Caballeronia sordidicola]